MKTSLPLITLLIAVLLVSGCAPAQPTIIAPPTSTSIPPAPARNVTCNGVTMNLAAAVGSGYACDTIPESSGAGMPAFSTNPEYTQITINNYPLTDRAFSPHIDIFPVQRFSELLPDNVPARLADLKSLIGGGTASGKELPFLPVLNQAQAFNGQVKVLGFQNGQGVRYITQYAQGPVPINNQALIYTFQGLTANGQYWISAVLPISSSNLMEDAKNPPNGMSWTDFTNSYTGYIAQTTAQLNAQAPESFNPPIPALDALVSSILAQP